MIGKEEELYVQCELQELDAKYYQPTGVKVVVWLPKTKGYQVDSIISLMDDSRLWKVSRMFTTLRHKDLLHTDWKVGGLS
jgi:hypothetical protein